MAGARPSWSHTSRRSPGGIGRPDAISSKPGRAVRVVDARRGRGRRSSVSASGCSAADEHGHAHVTDRRSRRRARPVAPDRPGRRASPAARRRRAGSSDRTRVPDSSSVRVFIRGRGYGRGRPSAGQPYWQVQTRSSYSGSSNTWYQLRPSKHSGFVYVDRHVGLLDLAGVDERLEARPGALDERDECLIAQVEAGPVRLGDAALGVQHLERCLQRIGLTGVHDVLEARTRLRRIDDLPTPIERRLDDRVVRHRVAGIVSSVVVSPVTVSSGKVSIGAVSIGTVSSTNGSSEKGSSEKGSSRNGSSRSKSDTPKNSSKNASIAGGTASMMASSSERSSALREGEQLVEVRADRAHVPRAVGLRRSSRPAGRSRRTPRSARR